MGKVSGGQAAEGSPQTVIVALDASKNVVHALEWALKNAIQPQDSIILLAIVPPTTLYSFCKTHPGWGKLFGWLLKECGSIGMRTEKEITNYYSQLLQHLCTTTKITKVSREVKVLTVAPKGAVAKEAEKRCASWVILDRCLMNEGELCAKSLQCNVIVVDHKVPKFLRLNLKHSRGGHALPYEEAMESDSFILPGLIPGHTGNVTTMKDILIAKTKNGSPKSGKSSNGSNLGTQTAQSSGNSCSAPSLDPNMADLQPKPNDFCDKYNPTKHWNVMPGWNFAEEQNWHLESSNDDVNEMDLLYKPNEFCEEKKPAKHFNVMPGWNFAEKQNWQLESSNDDVNEMDLQHKPNEFCDEKKPAKHLNASPGWNFAEEENWQLESSNDDVNEMDLQHKPNEFYDKKKPAKHLNASPGWNFAEEEDGQLESSNDDVNGMNKAIESVELKMRRRFMASVEQKSSINTQLKVPSEFPSLRRVISLCSVCQNRAPAFGQPPMKFSYKDLEYATNGFSQTNFLAEGGCGPVYKGTLPDGQVVAVKQFKIASRQQGAREFYAEVKVLSCAQHKNVVRLIGYCREGGKWLLVYEFACNGTLYNHLHGEGETEWMDWKYRHKVAVGVARGLRYLHEECRGGCIIHRDLRPSNILLTHDFTAMVGDFGLAKWQPDGESAEETHILGTLGYLAPEYTRTGRITEKADVFSFGVILLEMVSGRKAIDICRNRVQQRLSEWARPMFENRKTHELIDPHLENRFSERELQCMMYAASICIDENPESRPRISQVLRILEGDDSYEKVCSWISPSRDKSLPEIDLASKKSRETERWTVRSSTRSSKTSCRRWIHGQNVALDRPEIRPIDYSLGRRQCDFEGISDSSSRSIPPSRFKTISGRGTLSFGCNTGMQSSPINGHHFGKVEDHTEGYSILTPRAKTMERDIKNIILTSHDSNTSLSRDTFEISSSEFGSSSNSRNSSGTGSDFPYNGWLVSNNGLHQSDDDDDDDYDIFPSTPANSVRRSDHIELLGRDVIANSA
ncbi:hypothetical protein SUGI_0739440 [Cryptomeria japonica]|nr:hypothetical protein SUGI_0739440 [Cryptomeria japonica]